MRIHLRAWALGRWCHFDGFGSNRVHYGDVPEPCAAGILAGWLTRTEPEYSGGKKGSIVKPLCFPSARVPIEKSSANRSTTTCSDYPKTVPSSLQDQYLQYAFADS